MAVKVTELPAQPGLDPAVSAMDTEGVTLAFTDIVIVLELLTTGTGVPIKIILGLLDPVTPVVVVHAPAPPALSAS